MHRLLIVRMALLAGCLWNVPALEGADATKKEPLPLIKVASDLFDQTDGQTLGLPSIPGEHTVLYHATEDSYKFCHQQNIGIFKDRLYVMWSNGILPEDQSIGLRFNLFPVLARSMGREFVIYCWFTNAQDP